MAIKVTISVDLEKRLLKMMEFSDPEAKPGGHETPGTYSATTARRVIALIQDARSRKKVVEGLSPQEAIRVIRSVLGSSAALPPTQTPAFYGFIKKRINFLGLTADDVERAAIRAKHTYKLPTSVHWIMTTIDRLVSSEPEEDKALGVGTPKVMTGREEA